MAISNELDKLLSKSNISKNQLIKETGIDRSTFFQIMSGKRFPSESIFRSLLLFFTKRGINISGKDSITRHDLDLFFQSYLHQTLNNSEYELWKVSARFIKEANASISSYNRDCSFSEHSHQDQQVYNFLTKQLSVSNGTLKFYLSPELLDRFHINELIRTSGHSDLTIQQLSGIYQNSSAKYISSLLSLLARSIDFLDEQSLNYSIYYTDDSDEGKQNILFPYYLIGANEALLLSDDGNESFLATNGNDVEMIQKRFDEILTHSTPLFTQEKDYMGLAQKLFAKYQSDEVQQIYSVAERPCFLEMVTQSIISKYAPTPEIEQFGTSYVNTIKSITNFYALNSPDGVKQFEKDRHVIEAGMDFKIDDSDMDLLHEEYEKALWDKIILLPFSNCFIHNWEIAVYYPETMFLSRYDNTDCIICIRDDNLINTLFTYYNSMFRLLHK